MQNSLSHSYPLSPSLTAEYSFYSIGRPQFSWVSSEKFRHTFHVLGMPAAVTELGELVGSMLVTMLVPTVVTDVAELGSESPYTVPVPANLWHPLWPFLDASSGC